MKVTHIIPAKDIVLDDVEQIDDLPRESHLDGDVQHLYTNMAAVVSANVFIRPPPLCMIDITVPTDVVILPGMPWVRKDVQVARPYVRGNERRYEILEVRRYTLIITLVHVLTSSAASRPYLLQPRR